jgi:hypothetical protein
MPVLFVALLGVCHDVRSVHASACFAMVRQIRKDSLLRRPLDHERGQKMSRGARKKAQSGTVDAELSLQIEPDSIQIPSRFH